ncbi:DUF4134 domain-containing protein [Chitinophaga arvensicola]|nr:DUF4134 domain-containing protein [Chitinophaga arvensicola]
MSIGKARGCALPRWPVHTTISLTMKRTCAINNKISFAFKKYWLRFQILLLLLVCRMASFGQASAGGKKGFESATKEVTGYFSLGINLMYAVGAVCGIVGAVKVYQKWNSGDQDTGKSAAAWLGSCVFLIAVSAFLKGFFNIT